MRIGIDARFFGPQESGIGRYVERLITHLAKLNTHHEFVVFLRAKAWDLWQPPNPRWSKVLADIHWYGLREQLLMPQIIARAKVHLMHFTHFNVPLMYRRPFVATIHDLILDEFPTERATTLEPIIFKIKFAAYQRVLRHAIRHARHVVTPSGHSRQNIIDRFQVDPTRVSVTYESVDPFPEPVPLSSLSERGVQQPYLLHVGNSYPHKNLETFLDAAGIAVDRGERFQVVLVGKHDYFAERIRQTAEHLGLKNVLMFGFASEQELASLYRHAQAYFFPSLSEGFGLPGLEAMLANIPVFAARVSCFPEVYASAAHYFDPLNAEEMADSIRLALHDTLLKQRLITAGQARLKEFSWNRMAIETLAVYEHALPAYGSTSTA